MNRVALYLQDAHPLADCIRYAKYAEERGFEAVWQAESRLVRDAVVPMAAYAAVTTRIKVGSGVINNWTRTIGGEPNLSKTFDALDFESTFDTRTIAPGDEFSGNLCAYRTTGTSGDVVFTFNGVGGFSFNARLVLRN